MKNTNLIIGKINTGKTTGILFNEVNSSITNKENLLINDYKGEYYKTFGKKLKDNNYNVLVLNLKETENSNSFNPLLLPYSYYKKGNKEKATVLINELALELCKDDTPNTDPFWQEMASNYFTALTLILFKEAKEEEINLGSIQVMLSISDKNEDNQLNKYFDKLDVLDTIYTLASPIVYAPRETKGSIISVLKQKINLYCLREQLFNNLLGSEIDLNNLTDKTAIIIINDEKLGRIGNILINQIYNTGINFTYYLDDLDKMPVLLELKSMLEDKLKLYASCKNIEVIKEKYGKYITDNFENVLDNVEVKDCLNVGTYNDYPIAKTNNRSFINVDDIV